MKTTGMTKLMCEPTLGCTCNVPADILRSRSMRRPCMLPDSHYIHFNVAKVANELNKLGFHPIIDAHSEREGLAAHWGMWMFAQVEAV